MQMELNLDDFVDIPNYEGLYKINKEGDVYSCKSNKILKQELMGCKNKEYYSVQLSKNGKVKHAKIHRLIAKIFIPNPQNKPTVDHINRNRLDNRIENLQWADYSEQNKNRNMDKISVNYITMGKSRSKAVEMRDKRDHSILLKTFDSIVEASLFLFDNKKAVPHITHCAQNKRKSAYGYWWCYKKEY